MRLAPFCALLVCGLLVVSSPARGDVLWRLLQDGTGVPSQPSQPSQSDDLTAWAGPARATSLPDLLRHAQQHTPSLANAKLDIDVARARIEQTMARDDWQLRATVQAQRSTGGFFSGQQIDQSLFYQHSVDVFRGVSTGGTITFHTDSTYNSISFVDNLADSILGADNWNHSLNASFVQPLLRGRGRQLYEASERRATLSQDLAVLQKRIATIQVVQQIVSAYWDLMLAERQLGITRASLALARKRLDITQIGADGGKIPRSEIPAVQQIIATREEDVLNGELLVLDRSLTLRRLTGLPIGKGELGLRIGGDIVIGPRLGDLGDLTERAYAAAPELAQLKKQDKIAQLDIEVTENGLLTRLDAALTIGPTGQDGNFGTAWKNLVQFDTYAIGGQLRIEHSFGQENIRGQARELRTNRRRLQVTAFDIRAQIALTMARAVAQLELARRRLGLAQRAIDLAKENIKIEEDRFNLGKSTNFDVLNRQEELRQAELRKAQAIIDWHKAEVVVQALTGDLLPVYGIAVD